MLAAVEPELRAFAARCAEDGSIGRLGLEMERSPRALGARLRNA